MLKAKQVSGSVLLVAVSLLVAGCGSHDYYSNYKTKTITNLSVRPTDVTLRVGEKTNIEVSGKFDDGSSGTLDHFYANQSIILGEFENGTVYYPKYPGKTEIEVSSYKYVYESTASSADINGGSDSYIKAKLYVNVLPKEDQAPAVPKIEISEEGKAIVVKAYRDENTEKIELSYGTDPQASNLKTIDNLQQIEKKYWLVEISTNDDISASYCVFKFNYNFESPGQVLLDKNTTYYYKVRAVNRHGASDWSPAMVLLKETAQNKNNMGITTLECRSIYFPNNQILTRESQSPNPTSEGNAKLHVTVYNPDGTSAATGEVWVRIWTSHVHGVVPRNIAWEKADNGRADFDLPAGEYGWSADLRFSQDQITAGAGSMYQNITVNANQDNYLDINLTNNFPQR